VLGAALLTAWAWSRGLPWRPNPLEAAGAVLAVSGFLIAYVARGNVPIAGLHKVGWYEALAHLPYDRLRPLAWYHTLPQVGTVLFAVGWWSGRGGATGHRPLTLRRPTPGELAAVAGLAALLVTLHLSRARAMLLESARPMTLSQRRLISLPRDYSVPKFQRLRALGLAELEVARQRRFLAQLDRVEQICARRAIGANAIRRAFGRVVGPGFPDRLTHFDAIDVLDLPAQGSLEDENQVRLALGLLLVVEPEPRPPSTPPAESGPPDRDDE
jgi:hypothetical protein